MSAGWPGKNARRARWILPLVTGLTIEAFIVLADRVVLPMHARGAAQPVTAWINALSRLLELPGLFVAGILGLWSRGHVSHAAWLVMLAASFPIYSIGTALLRWLWTSKRAPVPPTDVAAVVRTASEPRGKPPSKGQLPTRRQFLMAGPRIGVIGAAAVSGYAFAIEPHRPVVTRRIFPLRGLPQELDGLTIVQLTDIHHGPWMSLAAVSGALVQTANALRPDIIALTGDYVHQSGVYIDPVINELAALRARIGVVAVLGNHDWWEGKTETLRAFARTPIPLIDNSRLFVTTGGTLRSSAASGLCLAGVDDLWEGYPEYQMALEGVPQSMPRILLSHNPDVAEEPRFLADRWRVDLMLSGHTHGGQIRIPGLGTPMIPSRHGQKYASGLVQGPACPVYVCRGIGTTIMPLRLGVPPEIAVIELKSA